MMNKTLYSFDTKNLYSVIKDSYQQAENAWKSIDLSGIDKEKIPIKESKLIKNTLNIE